MVNKILLDTDVWLDLASDYRKAPVLTALDNLVRAGAVELILPEIVMKEFGRNRERVVERSRRSLAGCSGARSCRPWSSRHHRALP